MVFDATTGAELWESIADVPQGVWVAYNVTVDHGRVFTAGPIRNYSSLLVRAHDAATGRLLWQDEIPDGQMFVTEPRRLVTKGGVLFLAAGILNANGDEDTLVRAYEERTGAIRWTQQFDTGGNDEASGLYASGNRLFVAGVEACDADFLGCSFTSRALDISSGELLWRDAFQIVPGGDANAVDLVVQGGQVFVGGYAQDATGQYGWLVRIYDARSGALLDEDRVPSGFAFALAQDDERIYATGVIANGFTVLEYNAQVDDNDDRDRSERRR